MRRCLFAEQKKKAHIAVGLLDIEHWRMKGKRVLQP